MKWISQSQAGTLDLQQLNRHLHADKYSGKQSCYFKYGVKIKPVMQPYFYFGD